MLHATKLIPGGRGLAAVLLRRAASIALDWDARQKSRLDAVDSQNRQLGIVLARGTVMRGGDVLVAEDGSLVRVVAADQPVLRVTACPEHGSPADLPRAAYHLGNRHVALEVRADHLQLEPDTVLADMLRRMHLIVNEVTAPFEPEGGAYAAASNHHAHGHDHHHHGHDHHGHDHHGHDTRGDGGHAHGSGPVHAHDHDDEQEPGFAQGPAHGQRDPQARR